MKIWVWTKSEQIEFSDEFFFSIIFFFFDESQKLKMNIFIHRKKFKKNGKLFLYTFQNIAHILKPKTQFDNFWWRSKGVWMVFCRKYLNISNIYNIFCINIYIPIQEAFGSKNLRPSFKCSSSQSDHILEKLAPSSCVSASWSLKILKSSLKEGPVGHV